MATNSDIANVALICLLTVTLSVAIVVSILLVSGVRGGIRPWVRIPTRYRNGNRPTDWGRYRIERKLAQGGMTDILLVHYRENAQIRRVLKVLVEKAALDQEAARRFLLEGELLTRLHRQSGVPAPHFYRAARAAPWVYLELEYLPGEQLDTMLKLRRPMHWNDIQVVARDVTIALEVTHREGYCHFDVSPDNILVSRKHGRVGNAWLIDFGVAEREFSPAPFGKVPYMSPEQCAAEQELSRASDMYSFGVVLYQMATGQVPFVPRSGNTQEVMDAHRFEPPPPLPDAILEPLRSVVEDLLRKDPRGRPTASETRARLSGADAFDAPAYY